MCELVALLRMKCSRTLYTISISRISYDCASVRSIEHGASRRIDFAREWTSALCAHCATHDFTGNIQSGSIVHTIIVAKSRKRFIYKNILLRHFTKTHAISYCKILELIKKRILEQFANGCKWRIFFRVLSRLHFHFV